MKRRKGDPLAAVAYLRVSTDRQELGPEAQRAAVERWAAARGARIVAWQSDIGVSGATPVDERPGLLAALDDVRAHGAGLLVAAKRDRLARDVVVAAVIESTARAAGAEVVTADGAGEGDAPEAQLMRTLLDAFAQYERAIIRARIRGALAQKKFRGERTGGVPFGRRPGPGGKLVDDASEQRTIALVLELDALGLTVRDIAAELERRGVRGRTGRPLNSTQVWRILQRRPAAVAKAA